LTISSKYFTLTIRHIQFSIVFKVLLSFCSHLLVMAHAPTHDDLRDGLPDDDLGDANWGPHDAPGDFEPPEAAAAADRGPADVQGLYPLVFAENLMFTKRMVPPRHHVNAVVPTALDEVQYLRMLHVMCHGLATIHNLYSLDTIDAITIFQGLGPYFPNEAKSSDAEIIVNLQRAAVTLLGNVGGILDKVAPEAPARWAAAIAPAFAAAAGIPGAPAGPLQGINFNGVNIDALPITGALRADHLSMQWSYRALAVYAS
jgi:hypothetical protein